MWVDRLCCRADCCSRGCPTARSPACWPAGFLPLIAFIGIACAAYLLIYRLMRFGAAGFRQGFFWVVLLMLVLILVGEFGVQPILESLKAQALPKEVMDSVFRERFATWHGVASVPVRDSKACWVSRWSCCRTGRVE